MRLILLAIAFTAAASVVSASEQPNARAAYVERRGLVEADAQCGLFSREMRAALDASTAQARGALLRAGWSSAQVGELETAVISAARARTCGDPRTAAAVADANSGFAIWINANVMNFPGSERTWTAHRVAASDGWRLRQPIDAPFAAAFGIREHNGVQELVLLAPGANRHASARLSMRDPTRSGALEISLPQRMAYGLEAGLSTPDIVKTVSSLRRIERVNGGRTQAVFVFPDAAFRDLLALDPRETVAINLTDGRTTRRLLVEVGDIGAARAFLIIRPH